MYMTMHVVIHVCRPHVHHAVQYVHAHKDYQCSYVDNMLALTLADQTRSQYEYTKPGASVAA